jgi:pilus assembly protein CpaC
VNSCRILVAASVGLVLGGVQLRGQTAPQQQQGARELVLTAGKSLVVNTSADIERIAVGFGDVAEARAVGLREVLLDGKAPGETSLIIWQQGGNKLFFDVSVLANTSLARGRLDSVRRQIAEELPDQPITVAIENDMVFLRGTARDLTSAQRAVTIASTAGKVANLLYVDVPGTEAQILLKVRFATVDRNMASDLGVNLFSLGGTNTVGRVSTGQFQAPTVAIPDGKPTATLSEALNVFLFRPDLNLGATIKALETRGVAEILAEPNVLAINGKQASFLAGGEFPYPILQGGQGGLGTITVAFREFGVRINFLPLVTPRGTIRLTVTPEVSSLDYTAGLVIQGYNIPGLATRRVETEIELEAGQSFGIGGLLDRRLSETIQKIPLLADVPLLGKLFQSRTLSKRNDELLVIVTPQIVKPLPAGQIPAIEMPKALPGDEKGAVSATGAPVSNPSPATERMPVERLIQQLKSESEMTLQKNKTVSSWPGAEPLPMPGSGPPSTTSAPAGTVKNN